MARWRNFVVNVDGYIDPDIFEHSRAALRVVGDCDCGGVMRALAPELVGNVTWYQAVCENDGTHELAAPNGRTSRARRTEAANKAARRRRAPATPSLADLVDPRRPGERDAV